MTPPPILAPAPPPPAPVTTIRVTPQPVPVLSVPEIPAAQPRAHVARPAPAARVAARTVTHSSTTATRTLAETPAAAPEPPPAPAAAPVPARALPEASAPPPEQAAPAPAPVTTRTAGPIWPWLLGGAILVLGALGLLLRRRRTEYEAFTTEYEPETVAPPVDEPMILTEPAIASGRTEADATPLTAFAPIEPQVAAAEDATIAEPDAAELAVVTEGSEPIGHRPWIELGMRPVRAGTSEEEAMVEIELTVRKRRRHGRQGRPHRHLHGRRWRRQRDGAASRRS
ncbi:MAG: hypothetical protein WDN44_13580 [Sphingomonas sp.]